MTYGNGATTTYLYYSSNNRLYSITTNSPAAGGLQNLSYTYDNAGNITVDVDKSLFAGPGAFEAYYHYAGGVWTEDTTFDARLGQTVKIYVKNVNVLGTTISIEDVIYREAQQRILQL